MLRKSLSERKLLQFPGRWQGLQKIGQKLIAATDKSLPALKADLQLHVVSTSLLLARAYLEVKQLYRSIYYLVYLDVVTLKWALYLSTWSENAILFPSVNFRIKFLPSQCSTIPT